MKYIVIGLGNYGQALAKELTAMRHEVIGVDVQESNVEAVKDSISTSFILDATNEQSLSILPLRSVDAVIVAVGKTFGVSVKVTALLKKNNAKRIYARALDAVHKSVLEAFDIDMVLMPEQDAARELVSRLDLRIGVESMQLDSEHYIMKFQVPSTLFGLRIKDLAMERLFDLRMLALLSGERKTNCLGVVISDKTYVDSIDADYKLCDGDYLVCCGNYDNFVSFLKSV